MNFPQAIATCFTKYVTFSGRASRSEYWYFFLFNFLLSLVANIIDVSVLHVGTGSEAVHPISSICSLLTLLPGLAVAIRRLHDVNRSGWWILIAFTIIGAIFPLLVWNCRKGTTGDNRFGPNPLAGEIVA